jgi:GT2 family glycosyltransferase
MVVYWWKDRPVGHEVIDHDGTKHATGLVDPVTLEAVRNEERAARVPQLTASVVICTRDRPDALRRCLASLHRQTFPPREVIVVDNASGDARTRDVALGGGATYVREDRVGLDFARNAGVRLASAEIVAYTDDDVVLHRRWLEGLVAAFDIPEIAAVTGLVLPAELATDAQRHFETYWSFGRGYRRKDYDPASFAAHTDSVFPAWEIGAGASMAFRRTIFEQIGHFDERLDVGQAGCSGDSELWYRIIAAGYTCRYEPRSVAFHFHRRSIEGLANQIYHYMRGHAAALLVQHERTGIAANRVQAWWRMPRWYGGRLKRRLQGVRVPEDRFLREEITGYLSGLLFYVRNRQR